MSQPLKNQDSGPSLAIINDLTLASETYNVDSRPKLNLNNAKQLDKFLKKELREIAKTSNIPAFKEVLLFKDVHTDDMLGILDHASPQQRIALSLTLIKNISNEASWDREVGFKLPIIFHYLKYEEKQTVLGEITNLDPTSSVQKTALLLMQSSRSLSELDSLSKCTRGTALASCNNPELVEIFALSTIGTRLSKIPRPKKVTKFANTPLLNRRIEALTESLNCSLESLREILKEHKEFKKTTAHQQYKEIVSNALRYLKDGRETINQEHSPNEKPKPKKVHQVKDLYNTTCAMLELGLEYCLLLTAEENKPTGRLLNLWSEKQMEEAQVAFKMFPAGRILLEPKLYKIIRIVRDRDEDMELLGAREWGTGVIYLGNYALCDGGNEELYPHMKSLTSVLVHEIVHGFQLGASPETEIVFSKEGEILAPCDPSFRFSEFLSVADWKVIYPCRGKLTSNDKVLEIDGKEYKLYVRQIVDGKAVRIMHSRLEFGVVFSRLDDAEFPYGEDCYSNPYEDIAEVGTDYLLDPSTLLFYSPKKFLIFERMFRKYDSNQEILSKLHYRLRNPEEKKEEFKTAISKGEHKKFDINAGAELTRSQVDFLKKRFSHLTAYEQAKVLAKIQITAGSIHGQTNLNAAIQQHERRTQAFRDRLFGTLTVKSPENANCAFTALLEEYKNYSPVLLTALNAIYNREQIAFMTSRGNREGHAPLREALYGFLDYRIPEKNEHFLADSRYRELSDRESRLSRKTEMILGLLRGNSFAEDGTQISGQDKPRIVYYDNDADRIRELKKIRQHFRFKNGLQLVSSTRISHEKEWVNLLSKVRIYGDTPPAPTKKVIRIFDLDGCLINLPSRIHLKNSNGEIVKSLSQSEFSVRPLDSYWLQQQAALTMDFSEFFDSNLIALQIVESLRDNRLFKSS